jgi:O-antigen/teichoic acid export membrane protein
VRITVDTLADELASLLEDTPRRRALGEAGRAWVEREHEAHVIARRLVALVSADRCGMSLRESLRRLSGESLIYGLGQASGRAVNLLLVPVLTRVLLKQQFGVAELVTGYSASLLLVLVFGMDGALARFFYQQDDRAARVRMTSSSFLFRLLTGGTIALTLALCATPLAEHLMGGAVYAKYLRLGALTLPCTLLVLWCNDVLRVTFQPWKFVTLNVSQTVLVGGLTVYLVVVRQLGVVGVLYGKLIGTAAPRCSASCSAVTTSGR